MLHHVQNPWRNCRQKSPESKNNVIICMGLVLHNNNTTAVLVVTYVRKNSYGQTMKNED